MPWLPGSSSSRVNTHTFWLVVPPTWKKSCFKSKVHQQALTHHHSGLAGVHAQLVPLHRPRAVIVGTPELETQVVVHLHLEKVFSQLKRKVSNLP